MIQSGNQHQYQHLQHKDSSHPVCMHLAIPLHTFINVLGDVKPSQVQRYRTHIHTPDTYIFGETSVANGTGLMLHCCCFISLHYVSCVRTTLMHLVTYTLIVATV